MANYEITVIGRQDLSQQQVDTLHKDVKDLITNNDGSINKDENWGLRNFAYKIRKNKKGHYLYQEATIEAEGLAEVDRLLGLNEDVLRHLIVRVEKFIEGPTVMIGKQENDNDNDNDEGEESEAA